MKSRWNDREAAQFAGDLAQRVYTSRLLGQDESLVLHGGGNTSVKVLEKNIFGDEESVLYIKGRGRDLKTIEVEEFSPCRLERLLRLSELEVLSDAQLEDEFRLSMKYVELIWASLFRRKLRTILTLLSVLAAFLLFGLLDSVRSAFLHVFVEIFSETIFVGSKRYQRVPKKVLDNTTGVVYCP